MSAGCPTTSAGNIRPRAGSTTKGPEDRVNQPVKAECQRGDGPGFSRSTHLKQMRREIAQGRPDRWHYPRPDQPLCFDSVESLVGTDRPASLRALLSGLEVGQA